MKRVSLKICGELIQYEWLDGALARAEDIADWMLAVKTLIGLFKLPKYQLQSSLPASTEPNGAIDAGNVAELR